MDEGVFLGKKTKKQTSPTNALDVISTAGVATGNTFKSASPPPVKAQLTKNANMRRKHITDMAMVVEGLSLRVHLKRVNDGKVA